MQPFEAVFGMGRRGQTSEVLNVGGVAHSPLQPIPVFIGTALRWRSERGWKGRQSG